MADDQLDLFDQCSKPVKDSKICRICGDCKPITQFRITGKNKTEIRNDCRQCEVKTARKWQKENPEIKKEHNKNWNKNNPEKAKVIRDAWRDKNKEDIAAKVRATSKAWELANPEAGAAKAAKRRAAKRQQLPNWLTVGHFVEMQGYYQWCSIFSGHHVDHIYPIQSKQVAGFHAPQNLQILTQDENQIKFNKLPDPTTIAPYIEHPTLVIDADGFASLKFEE